MINDLISTTDHKRLKQMHVTDTARKLGYGRIIDIAEHNSSTAHTGAAGLR